MYSKDPEIKRTAIRNLWPMVDMCLGREIEVNYHTVLSDLATCPDFQCTILQALPDV